jgi:hypothetical protein
MESVKLSNSNRVNDDEPLRNEVTWDRPTSRDGASFAFAFAVWILYLMPQH